MGRFSFFFFPFKLTLENDCVQLVITAARAEFLSSCALIAQPQSRFIGMSLLIWSFVYLVFNIGGEVLKWQFIVCNSILRNIVEPSQKGLALA